MNPWKENSLEGALGVLRFVAWGGLLFNGILIALFSVAIIALFLFRAFGWLFRHCFDVPWQ